MMANYNANYFFRDHMSFISEMKVLIQSDELAKDVAGAEALLEHHQEHKVSVNHMQIIVRIVRLIMVFTGLYRCF